MRRAQSSSVGGDALASPSPRGGRLALSTMIGAKSIEIDRPLFSRSVSREGSVPTKKIVFGRTDSMKEGYQLFQDIERTFDTEPITCPTCGMVYFPDHADEVKLHDSVHEKDVDLLRQRNGILPKALSIKGCFLGSQSA